MKDREEGQAKDPIRHIDINGVAKCNSKRKIKVEFFFLDSEHMFLSYIQNTSIRLCKKCLKMAKKEIFKEKKIKIAPTLLTPEQQAQIERMGYYPKDGYFEKRAYVMPEPPPEKEIVYAEWKGGSNE